MWGNILCEYFHWEVCKYVANYIEYQPDAIQEDVSRIVT